MTAWTSRSLGSRLQHEFFYALISFGGVRMAYALLFWVTLWYMFKPEAIRRNEPYLSRRFPQARFPMRLVHRWRRQWEFGKALVDRAAAGIRGGHCNDISREDHNSLTRIHEERKGLILLTAHVGNWQLSIAGLPGLLPAPINFVLYRDLGDLARHYFEHRGETPPFNFINPAGGPESAFSMAQTLFKGGTLGMMGDRPFGNTQNCHVPFLGETISLPYTPYYLASVTGAPIVVVFSYRYGIMKVSNVIASIFRVPANLGKNPAVYEPYARHFVEALEESARNHPYQFFNFYNMWDNNGYQEQTQSRVN